MKLIKHDSSQMVFRNKSSLFTTLFMLLWGAGFAGIPLFMAFITVKDLGAVSLSCDRGRWNQVNCQISKSKFFGIVPGEILKIDSILSANHLVRESKDSDGDQMVDHRVNISTKTGNVTYGESFIYVNGVRGNSQDSGFVANQITQFLESRDLKLSITKSLNFGMGQFLGLLFFVPFLLFGFGAIFFVLQTTTLILDKNLGKVSRKNISLIGIRTKSFPLADANKVEIQDYTDSYNNEYFTPVIMLASGEKFPLERVGHRDKALIMANQIRSFLYLPTESK
jgi:hypothetical protein